MALRDRTEWILPQDHEPPLVWLGHEWEVEQPGRSGDRLEAWCYTERFSYEPGDRVDVHAHATAPTVELTITRDGADPHVVLQQPRVRASSGSTSPEAFRDGCDWPVIYSFTLGSDWAPGFYLLSITASDEDGRIAQGLHFFTVRNLDPEARAPAAILLTTSTLLAYNDWGGANHYRGVISADGTDTGATVVSARRPISRGFLSLPSDAPRECHHDIPPPEALPRYPSFEWSLINNYTRHYSSAFWAMYERPFVCWAENRNFEFDYLTQHDLHFDPSCVRDYSCVVIVGHDEYWSWEMRDALDAYVEGGGRVARFAGNFLWQVRLSDDGSQQTCHKLPESDPFWSDPSKRHLTTTAWDVAGRPGAQTMGLTGLAGIFNRFGAATPRSSGGFTLYRPDHWAFAETGLCYGDLIGGVPACIAAFEVDGLDYTMEHGLPYPTTADEPPDGLEILAVAPAVLGERDEWNGRVPIGATEFDFYPIFEQAWGPEKAKQRVVERRYGSGMIASFRRGKGEVFIAGGTEWVHGLIKRDPFVERITHNVLSRFTEHSR